MPYAEVAVNTKINEENCVFDYIIPERYLNEVKEGIRVIVPFGNRLLEGYVINIKEISEIKPEKLKEIANIPALYQIFNKKQISLVKWISNKYMCTLAESFRCIMPSEMVIKESKYVHLINDDCSNIEKLNENEKRIISELKIYGGIIPYSRLCKISDKNLSGILNKMSKSGIISIEKKSNSIANDKIVKGIKLNANCLNPEELIKSLSGSIRTKSQAMVLDVLLKLGIPVAQKELIEKYSLSKYAVTSLLKRGIIDNVDLKITRDPYSGGNFLKSNKPELTEEQKNVIDKILKGFYDFTKREYLIHGVTGSGKTEVYMQLIEHMIKGGRQAIMLVPEISLTPQTVERFKSRFERVAVIHSRLSAGERYDEWRRIKDGEVDVVVGARSAVFAPLDDVGIIIIDEEHENSYKSDKTPKYHVKDIANKRCEIENAILVLGSATPSIETYYQALRGKYTICNMKKRVDNRELPSIEAVDMRREMIEGNRTIFSRKLYNEIRNALNCKHQVILFLNRRGFSTFVSCRKCGLVMKCPRCDVSLTYHMDSRTLQCHYCNYTIRSPENCPSCGSKYIKYFGIGTQKVESETKKCFPDAKILRMDMDTTSKKGSHGRIYNAFKNKEADILIGTQMIAKGLDFPDVTVVGIIAADLTLNIPEFKACERTYQLITQVAGRAGRGIYEGRVIVQTYNPKHYSIESSLQQDYIRFYNKEIMVRKAFNYPPFSELVNIIITSNIQSDAANESLVISKKIEDMIGKNIDIDILGPSPAPIFKINMNYRWQIIIKGKISSIIKKNIKDILDNEYMNISKSIKLNLDINPVNLA